MIQSENPSTSSTAAWIPAVRPAARRMGLGLLALLALALPLDAIADKSGKPGLRRNPGDLVERHAERLGLDEQTLAAVKEIVRSSGARAWNLRREVDEARRGLHNLLAQDAPRASEVFEQARRIGELEVKARINRLEAAMAVRAKLNPAQLEELVRIRDEERASSRPFMALGPCSFDAREHCGDRSSGPQVLTCLAERWETLSPGCQHSFAPSRVRQAPAR